MSYRYREVKCPWCDHVFMWNKNSGEGLLWHNYRLKTTHDPVEEAKCPCCGETMIVLEHVLVGIDLDDERVEKVPGTRCVWW